MAAEIALVLSVLLMIVDCNADEEVFSCKPNRFFSTKVETIVEAKLEHEMRSLKVEMQGFGKYMESDEDTDDNRDLVIEELKERLRAIEEKIGMQPQLSDCPQTGLSGIYTIHGIAYPEGVKVYCDTETDGGGWMVFQRRENGKLDFNRDWADYVKGFGRLSGEFWLGFYTITKLLSSGKYELRIDLRDWEGNKAYALYKHFSIGNASDNYKITVGEYSGTAGDSLGFHSGMGFTTKDNDNDRSEKDMCRRFKGRMVVHQLQPFAFEWEILPHWIILCQ